MAKKSGAVAPKPPNPLLQGKPYVGDVDELTKHTAVRPTDIDVRTVRLLDYLDTHGGRVKAACQHLDEILGNRKREDITNWRKYIYTLLRSAFRQEYREMKFPYAATVGVRRSVSVGAKTWAFKLNPQAPDFTPGHTWPEHTEMCCKKGKRLEEQAQQANGEDQEFEFPEQVLACFVEEMRRSVTKSPAESQAVAVEGRTSEPVPTGDICSNVEAAEAKEIGADTTPAPCFVETATTAGGG